MTAQHPGGAGLTRRGLVPALGGAAGAVAWAGQAQAQAQAPLADTPTGTVLGPGTHRVERSTTVKTDLVLMPGARIDIAAGRTLTVLGDVSAPVAHVFHGGGMVDLNRSRSPVAHPEWWGAVTNQPGADCLAALQACIAAHPVTQLRSADYYLSGTLRIDRPHRRIWGAGYRGSGDGNGTRLIVRSASADVVHVGPASRPAQVNDFLQGIDLRWMDLTRTEPVEGDAAGLRAEYLLHCQFEGVSAREHATGFVAKGVVRTFFRDCIGFRSLPGKGRAPFRGFHLDGSAAIGLAGGNASIFLSDCNVSMGGSPGTPDAVGLLIDGAFADSFIVNFETAGVATGIRIAGQAQALGGRAKAGHANLHIRMPIIDQCAAIGLDLSDISEYGLVDISEPYVAVAPGALAALRLDRVRGAVSVQGGQLIGWVDADAGGNALGLYATDCDGLAISGLKILDCRRPIGLERCSGVAIGGIVNNPGRGASQAAVWLRDCRRVRIAVQVKGRAGAFPQGVLIADGRGEAIRIDATEIDPASTSSGRVVLGDRPLEPGQHGAILVEGL